MTLLPGRRVGHSAEADALWVLLELRRRGHSESCSSGSPGRDGGASGRAWQYAVSVYSPGEMPIQSCGQNVSTRRGKRHIEIGLCHLPRSRPSFC